MLLPNESKQIYLRSSNNLSWLFMSTNLDVPFLLKGWQICGPFIRVHDKSELLRKDVEKIQISVQESLNAVLAERIATFDFAIQLKDNSATALMNENLILSISCSYHWWWTIAGTLMFREELSGGEQYGEIRTEKSEAAEFLCTVL